MRVRLTQKFADMLDGIDLRRHRVGDTFDLPSEHAQLLIAEAWAVPHPANDEFRPPSRSVTANGSTEHAKKRRA
jgi:hypothetical protein